MGVSLDVCLSKDSQSGLLPPALGLSRGFLKYFSSSIISASRYDMIAKQKQIEYQANTLKQLHETDLQYEARFKKTPPADPCCIVMIKGIKRV